MVDYTKYYRIKFLPWEKYSRVSWAAFESVFDRWLNPEDATRPPGQKPRILDLGCGRGVFSRELARRGWDVVGVDIVPQAIEEAKANPAENVEFRVADVTRLFAQDLGKFDAFVDIGCFQGISQPQRKGMAAGIRSLANPDATFVLLAFTPNVFQRFMGGVSEHEVAEFFNAWDILETENAPRKGLGFSVNIQTPRWYRMKLAAE